MPSSIRVAEQPVRGHRLHHHVRAAPAAGQEARPGQHAPPADRLAIPERVEQRAGPHPAFLVERRAADQDAALGREHAAPRAALGEMQHQRLGRRVRDQQHGVRRRLGLGAKVE
jgi:hypothetical protein